MLCVDFGLLSSLRAYSRHAVLHCLKPCAHGNATQRKITHGAAPRGIARRGAQTTKMDLRTSYQEECDMEMGEERNKQNEETEMEGKEKMKKSALMLF